MLLQSIRAERLLDGSALRCNFGICWSHARFLEGAGISAAASRVACIQRASFELDRTTRVWKRMLW